jgi:hypothetical protein
MACKNVFKFAVRLLETDPVMLCHGVLANNSGSPMKRMLFFHRMGSVWGDSRGQHPFRKIRTAKPRYESLPRTATPGLSRSFWKQARTPIQR